jgi:hypothetical protein
LYYFSFNKKRALSRPFYRPELSSYLGGGHDRTHFTPSQLVSDDIRGLKKFDQ